MSEPTPDDIRFEDALAELEQVVHDLEDGQIGLEDSLARYERGVGLRPMVRRAEELITFHDYSNGEQNVQ